MSFIETVVYNDDQYPSAWISKSLGYPKKIADHFKTKGINVLNANELAEFLVEAINKKIAHRKIVLFSQDIVPKTICEEAHSNTLFREYLDAGGNVIWIGDIPLFYIGEKNKTDPQHAWKSGAPVYMVGILPIFSSTMRSVDVTSLGKSLGLRHHWTSCRPIINNETITPLAHSKNIGSDYYINIPGKKGLLRRFWGRIKQINSVELGTAKLSFGDAPTEPKKDSESKPYRSTLYETHVSAWIKNFNPDFPYSGFHRIWDYCPRILPDWMVEELFNFSKNCSDRLCSFTRPSKMIK